MSPLIRFFMNPNAHFVKSLETIESIRSRRMSVTNWCHLCVVAIEAVTAMRMMSVKDMNYENAFRLIFGYLRQSPKKGSATGQTLMAQWEAEEFFTSGESSRMTKTYDDFREHLMMTLTLMGAGDDDAAEDPELGSAYRLMTALTKTKDVPLFREIAGKAAFNDRHFRYLATAFDGELIAPVLDEAEEKEAPPEMSALERIAANTREIVELNRPAASYATRQLAELRGEDGQRRRAGTEDEIAQENLVLDKIGENPDGNLRGFVKTVLTLNPLPHGHPNTARGLAACYRRVYELLHPDRRKRNRKPTSRAS